MDKWDNRFLELATLVSTWSKDPSTKVGAVLVGADKEILSVGFNGFPRGIADTQDRLNDRIIKYKLVVHAEINAVLNAVRNGINVKGSTLYLIAKGNHGNWGGAPCIRCAVELINAGIAKVVTLSSINIPESWKESCAEGAAALKEAGVDYREID